MEILAGDIGGTNTRLAIYRTEDGSAFEVIVEEIFPSREFQCLEQILEVYLGKVDRHPPRACFGIAGPIIEQSCDATNLPWQISSSSVRERFGL